MSSPQTLTDPYEPNDDSGTAATISYNQYTYANIGTAIDQDWYKINLTVSSDPDEIVAFYSKIFLLAVIMTCIYSTQISIMRHHKILVTQMKGFI